MKKRVGEKVKEEEEEEEEEEERKEEEEERRMWRGTGRKEVVVEAESKEHTCTNLLSLCVKAVRSLTVGKSNGREFPSSHTHLQHHPPQ